MTRRISIDQLQIGMFVTGFDRSWFRTPFLRHRFLIRSDDEIARLRRSGIAEVVIDPTRGADVSSDEAWASWASGSGRGGGPLKFEQIQRDLRLATEVKTKLEHTVHCLFDNITAMGSIGVEEAHDAVTEIALATRTLSHPALFMAMSQVSSTVPAQVQHALATCTLAMILGQAKQFSLGALQDLAIGALLHDIGLVRLPASLLERVHNSSRPLPEKDRRVYEGHARQGAIDLEQRGNFSLEVRRIVAEHHALPNGRGFPAEINPQWISVGSQIVMIADQYDDLLTGFGGRTPVPPHEALQWVYQQACNGGLDLELTTVFIKRVGVFPVYSTVELNTGERGIISELNPAQLHLPVIYVTHTSQGEALTQPLRVDLFTQEPGAASRSIVRVLKSNSAADGVAP